MTDYELVQAYTKRYGKSSYSTVPTRRIELRDMDLVEDTGERRAIPTTGNNAVVWRAIIPVINLK